MNENIKKLVQKSSSAVGYIGNWGRVQWADDVYPQVGDDLYAGVDLEKFAELIVRECAQFILVLDAEPVSHKSAARMLQEHFGVEE